MSKHILLSLFLGIMVLGCGAPVDSPLLPQPSSRTPKAPSHNPQACFNSHRLWGEWRIFIDETHERVDVVPRRQGRFHLNTLKFLEGYCPDCLKVTKIVNNGDGTIDLTVRITHPFPGHPEYTGFDVKGIIMFQGSHEFPENLPKYPLYPENFRASWRLLGDPELLNADGYTYYWSPWYDSGSEQPIFNYWEGKYASGTPTANVNGYLDFYSNETRHMFESHATVSRTYHIWLPAGPIEAGYAVDACWVPAETTPVTKPEEDFPITANQPEAYHFNCVVNDGNPIKGPCCNLGGPTVHEARAELLLWYVLPEAHPTGRQVGIWTKGINWYKPGCVAEACDAPPDECRCLGLYPLHLHPNGVYQLIAVEYHAPGPLPPPNEPVWYPAIDLIEIVIDID